LNHTNVHHHGVVKVFLIVRSFLSAFYHDAWRIIKSRYLLLAQKIIDNRIMRKLLFRGAIIVLVCSVVSITALVTAGIHYVCYDRTNLPDLQAFTRFDFPTVGSIYDVHDRPLIEMASECRMITTYKNIPPIVRDAIIAAEDKNFFSHSGFDKSGFVRALFKIKFLNLIGRLSHPGQSNEVNNAAIFPQGGSTITQQLVRGYFLKPMMAQENSEHLRHSQGIARVLSSVIGARMVNMLFRKLEEIRLSLWLEQEMEVFFGSKHRAKEEILARYASLIYMGNGQYGFARGAEYYFGRPLSTFTASDADKAALLAGAVKSPRYFAPDGTQRQRVLQRRNQVLELMAARGFISSDRAEKASQIPLETNKPPRDKKVGASAVVENVLQELKSYRADLSEYDLFQGHIQVHSTVNVRMQEISNHALERGLLLYEERHPSAKGIIQGSVVVLSNADASILAETGGRQSFRGRLNAYSDFNRVTKSLRQPGSAMKPIIYLAAFRTGFFNLESRVPDGPILVPDSSGESTKWISNYDGRFKGMMTLRLALAESRNAVAVWIAGQVGMPDILRTARTLGIQSPLHSFVSIALGASELSLLELANAYRTIASGTLSRPYVIRKVIFESGEVMGDGEHTSSPVDVDSAALLLIQEGLRGVVRMPSGTAHALDLYGLPFAVMGKTGTTNDFKDALFVGSTYGADGITVAVRIGFDDNSSLGARETGGRVALPVFREIMLSSYGEKLIKPAPRFPVDMEKRINDHLKDNSFKNNTANREVLHKMDNW
jgi:penicillin-binding protein 1A